MNQITIIKYGTAVLTTKDYSDSAVIDRNIIQQHGNIIARQQSPTLIVSSGAVGLGKTVLAEKDLRAEETTKKRLLAEVGQPLLFRLWQKSLPNRIVLQKLLTYADLQRKSTTETIKSALENNLLYIFNFNDGVDDSELKEDEFHEFGDNDHLAADIASSCSTLSDSTKLIINTSSGGVMNADTGKSFATLNTKELTPDFIQNHCHGVSGGGTGGMASKLKYVQEALANGVNEAWIINGKDPAQLKMVLNNKHAGTKITLS